MIKTPLLFYDVNRNNCWKRALLKIINIYQLELDHQISIHEFEENYLHKLPHSFLFINCEGVQTKKEDFVNKLREFGSLSFDTPKVCVIIRLELANLYVQNAILKSLEQFGEIQYLLVSTNINQIVPTILSRIIILHQKNLDDYKQTLINEASNYLLEITLADIDQYYKSFETNKLISVIARLNIHEKKKKDMETLKIVFLWQQYMLKKIADAKVNLTSMLAKQLWLCDQTLNLNAINFFSKSAILVNFFNNFANS